MAAASLQLTDGNREIIRIVGLTLASHLSGSGFDSAIKAHFLGKTKVSKKAYDNYKSEVKKTENKSLNLKNNNK